MNTFKEITIFLENSTGLPYFIFFSCLDVKNFYIFIYFICLVERLSSRLRCM